MAVEWAKLKRSREWSDDDQRMTKALRVYLVKCSDKINDTPDVAALACPAPGSYWSASRPDLRVTNRDVKELDDAPADGGTLYEATIDYATKSGDLDQRDENPLDRKLIVRLSHDSFEEPVNLAKVPPIGAENTNGTPITLEWKFGKKVCTSSGEPYDPTVTDEYRDPVLTFNKNLPYLPFNYALEWVNVINSADFNFTYRGRTYTVPKWCAWIYDITNDPRTENDVDYEECQLVMRLRKDTWIRKIVDEGFYQLVDNDNRRKPIRDKNGDPVFKPALLDGRGKPMSANQPPVFIKWRFKDEKAFSSLPFLR